MRKPTKESELNTEPIGQNLIKLISNLCFSVFVLSVLIFTAIAITYQPPDPWLESAPSLTKLFTQTENATFKIDDSIVKTGEDLVSSPVPAIPPALAPNPITETDDSIVKTGEDSVSSPVPAMSPVLATNDSVVKTSKDSVSSLAPAVSPVVAPNPVTKTNDSVVKSGEESKSSPAPAMSPALAPNPVTKTNDSVVRTGLAPAPATSPALAPTPIVETEAKTPKSDCEELKHVNCSDPRVLLAIKKFNSKTFKSIVILEYQTPVNGSKPDECDVAWRFRNKKERSWRKYRDFRRFEFGIGVNCTYRVIHTGRWHSGINARRPWIRPNPKFTRPIRDEEINDTIPALLETNFRKGKYLYYARGGDYCKGMNHYLWSFLCGLGEAIYLNRTFVMDLNMCLSATHSSSHKDEEGKDFRFYFDFEHLKETASVVEEIEFLRDWKKWDRGHKRKVPLKKIKSYKTTPMQLKKDKTTIIWRQFDGPEPDNYWYRVCEGQAAKYIHRPWHTIWKSKRLMNIVTEISGRMDWDFDAIHVIRGEKAQNKQLWPNLDSETSPNAILTKLQQMVQPWRNLYIATNEPFYNYFDNLRSHYKVHLLDDYKELWNVGSEWYNETTLLNGGKPVEFDGYMRAVVDTEVLYRAFSLAWLRGFQIRSKFRKYLAMFEFAQASGICTGTPVRIRGVTVGNVVRVNPSLKSIEAVVEVEDDKIIIPRNSLIEVNQSGLLMETLIDITPRDPIPSPSVGPLDAECVKEGLIVCDRQKIKGEQGVSLDALVGIVTRLARQMEEIGIANTYSLAERVAAVIQDAKPLLTKIEAMAEDVQPLLSELRDSGLLQEVENLTRSLTQASEDLRRVHSSIMTPENTELIQKSIYTLIFTLKNIENISSDILGFTGDESTRKNLKLLIKSLSRML